jgi:branched-chain amino acid:cation transporter, LIVCS family
MNKNVWVVGFAIFTMFFGAGNITFPLLLTQSWPNEWPATFLGFCLSGVLVTLIGLVGGVLARNTENFFAPLGLVMGMIMQIILVCIEGPFGVVPRCLIVAFGSIKEVLPQTNNLYFYIISAVILYFTALNKTILVKVIGKYITPIMLISLAAVIAIVVYQNKLAILDKDLQFSYTAFKDGITKGYLTYDLPGAIYFTTIAMGYLSVIGGTKKQMISNGLKACCISAVLLIIIYAAFFYLGATYNTQIAQIPVEQALSNIVKHSIGHGFAIIFAMFVVLACLTTAVAAITIWTDFIYNILKKYNVKYNWILIPSLMLAVFISNLNFTGLIKILSPVLTVLYPILVLLTLYNIVTKYKEFKATG